VTEETELPSSMEPAAPGVDELTDWLDGDDGRWRDVFGLWEQGKRDSRWVAELIAPKIIGALGMADGMTLVAELRAAYTLLVSAEPTLSRDADRADLTAVQAHFKALLRDKVKAWVDRYRDDFDGGLTALLASEPK
jgi:hypothetical protein